MPTKYNFNNQLINVYSCLGCAYEIPQSCMLIISTSWGWFSILPSINKWGNFMNKHEKINYVELPAASIDPTKESFWQAFSWSFEDFGLEYTAFSNEGLEGGFCKSELKSSANTGSNLIVFCSVSLEGTQKKNRKGWKNYLQTNLLLSRRETFAFYRTQWQWVCCVVRQKSITTY